MNKKEILDCLQKYNFDTKQYLVISSAAMVILGLKESTSDIDIAVTETYYNFLLKNYDCVFERVNEYNKKCYLIDNIINFCTTYYEDKKTIIENIPIQPPQKILELKKSLNRKKDSNDIKVLKEYIDE